MIPFGKKKIMKQKIHESLVSSKKKHEHDARDSYNLYLKEQKQKQKQTIYRKRIKIF